MNINDAKQKWCPFSRIREDISTSNNTVPPQGAIQITMPSPSVSVNRQTYTAYLHDGTKCIANQCMAWRTVLNDLDDGHCGLAGFQPHGG